MQTRAAVRTIDPAPAADDDRSMRGHVSALVFETLTAIAPDGGLRPALAISWERDGRANAWRIHLRGGVVLHGGSPLQSWQVAAALRSANPSWKITTDDNAVIVEPGPAIADLPWELASARNAIAVRADTGGTLSGSGPFRVERIESNRITLRAHDRYWGGRAFLDAVQIDTAVPASDLLSNLELGRSDLAPVLAPDARRLAQRGLRIVATRPLAAYALVFEPHRAGADALPIRRAIAAAVDRTAIHTVLLQGQGAAAPALLPSWLSGYSMTMPARGGRAGIAAVSADQRALTLRVEPNDPVAHAIAERVAVDARESAVTITVQAPAGLAPRPDIRLVRIAFDPTTPDRALGSALTALGPRTAALAADPAPPPGAAIDAVYRAERTLLDRAVVVPLVHLPEVYAIADRVEGWAGEPVRPSGGWNFANVWLRAAPPQRP